MTNTHNHETWAELLHSAVHTPGKLLAAYTAFHNYSFGNALLALTQCRRRNLEPGPLNTYRGWLELKRQVRKGEKGITLCMPMQYKKRVPKDNEQEEESEETTRSTFGFRAYWFVLAQTDGDAMDTAPIPGFDLDTALRTLNITRTEFDEMNGNIQGFAIGREIAISPIAAIPHKTTFHEIAHCVLGHTTKEKLVDSEAHADEPPRSGSGSGCAHLLRNAQPRWGGVRTRLYPALAKRRKKKSQITTRPASSLRRAQY